MVECTKKPVILNTVLYVTGYMALRMFSRNRRSCVVLYIRHETCKSFCIATRTENVVSHGTHHLQTIVFYDIHFKGAWWQNSKAIIDVIAHALSNIHHTILSHSIFDDVIDHFLAVIVMKWNVFYGKNGKLYLHDVFVPLESQTETETQILYDEYLWCSAHLYLNCM